MKSEWLVCRHGKDDDSYIDGYFDTDLTPQGVAESERTAENIADKLRKSIGERAVEIFVSVKKRTVQTGEIIYDKLKKESFEVKFCLDKRIRDFDHGFIPNANEIPHEEKVMKLALARKAFFNEYKLKKNYEYRLGQPLDDSRFSGLENFMFPYGETQPEFLYRLYDFTKEKLDKHRETQKIIVTHKATGWRLRQIAISCSERIDEDLVNEPNTQPSEWTMIEWKDIDVCRGVLANKISEIRKFL